MAFPLKNRDCWRTSELWGCTTKILVTPSRHCLLRPLSLAAVFLIFRVHHMIRLDVYDHLLCSCHNVLPYITKNLPINDHCHRKKHIYSPHMYTYIYIIYIYIHIYILIYIYKYTYIYILIYIYSRWRGDKMVALLVTVVNHPSREFFQGQQGQLHSRGTDPVGHPVVLMAAEHSFVT